MKKEMCLFAATVAVCSLTSCTSYKKPMPAAPEIISQYSIVPANLAPSTSVQGPVSTFKPIYSVDNSKRITATAKGQSEQEAKESAISKAIVENKCDDVFINKIVFSKWNNGSFECSIEAFAISIVDVEEIKTGIYEQTPDGKLVPMEKLEHKLVYVPPCKKVTSWTEDGTPLEEKEIPGYWEYTPVQDTATASDTAHNVAGPAELSAPAAKPAAKPVTGFHPIYMIKQLFKKLFGKA